MDISSQRLVEYATVRFSDPTDYRVDGFILSILWERKALLRLGDCAGGDNASAITHSPELLTQEVSYLVCLTNRQLATNNSTNTYITSNQFFVCFYLAQGKR